MQLANVDKTLITTTTNAALYSSGTDQFLLLRATVANTGTQPVVVTVWRVPSGGTVADGETIVTGFFLEGLKTKTLPLSGQTLVAGQALYASASIASVVNLSIGYAAE